VLALGIAVAEKYRCIVVTRLDGKPMPFDGLGPLWAA
jgi:hypothetical protein